jgi:hypothetical protein
MFDAEEVGPWVMKAVEENRPMVVDHSDQRVHFMNHYVNHALKAFDEAAAWEATMPRFKAKTAK